MAYCVASDLFLFGVPRGAAPNPGRQIDSLTASTIHLDVHSFDLAQPVTVRAIGALPSPLVEGTTYYVEPVTEATFKLRATPTGAALTIVDAVDPILVIEPLNIDGAIAWADAIIDDMLTGQVVPLNPVPQIVRITSAELAAFRLVVAHSAQGKNLSDIVDRAEKRLARWLAGRPIAQTAAETRDNLAITEQRPSTGERERWPGTTGADGCLTQGGPIGSGRWGNGGGGWL